MQENKQDHLSAPGTSDVQAQPLLWCVNVHGPDDVYAMPDRLSALERANLLNIYFGNMAFRENDPIMRAVVIEWPYSAESHAADLARAVAPAV